MLVTLKGKGLKNKNMHFYLLNCCSALFYEQLTNKLTEP